jgi:hypothetical protein
MTTDVLTHDLDGDPFTCSSCAMEPPELGANLHTLYAWLNDPHTSPADDPIAFPDEWCEAIADRARVRVAELTADELYCWCGHSLHYPDCACAEPVEAYGPGLTCAQRYRLEMYTPSRSGAGHMHPPRGWRCPGQDAEHWPGNVQPGTGDETGAVVVECGACGEMSAVYPDGTMEAV